MPDTSPDRPRHLLTVWNPSYSDSAMDAHLEVLLGWAQAHERAEADAEDVYVWWAKLRSVNRYQPLPHLEEILSIRNQVDAGIETHLYLTDYRSLYVAELTDLTDENVPEAWEGELDHMPLYYQDRLADFWFQLGDIRLLVADDTVATISELQTLRNTRYHDRPVSLYGGMVELPLIVRREDDVRWFSDSAALLDGRLWCERDSEMRGETERMARELRENLLGAAVWRVLEPATRTFLATAEAVFRSRRDDPGFDFSGPAVGYAKAVETEVNALLFPRLRKVLEREVPANREVRVDGRLLDLGRKVEHQTLGALAVLIERQELVQKSVRAVFNASDSSWIMGVLPGQLSATAELRNPAAHSRSAARAEVTVAREWILGVGQQGLLVRVAQAKMRG